MGNVIDPGAPPLIPPPGAKPTGLAILSQIVALAFGAIAVTWGSFCVYGAAFPGPCGDNAGPGLLVIESWLADVPLGLLTLSVGLFVKKGSPRLRRICIFTSLITLCLPVAATVLLQRRHC